MIQRKRNISFPDEIHILEISAYCTENIELHFRNSEFFFSLESIILGGNQILHFHLPFLGFRRISANSLMIEAL